MKEVVTRELFELEGSAPTYKLVCCFEDGRYNWAKVSAGGGEIIVTSYDDFCKLCDALEEIRNMEGL